MKPIHIQVNILRYEGMLRIIYHEVHTPEHYLPPVKNRGDEISITGVILDYSDGTDELHVLEGELPEVYNGKLVNLEYQFINEAGKSGETTRQIIRAHGLDELVFELVQ